MAYVIPRKIGKAFVVAVLFLFLAALFYLNHSVYFKPSRQRIAGVTVNTTLVKQLRFLDQAMRHDAAVQMQQVYPEGYVFMQALHSLAWCDVIASLPPSSDLYNEGHDAIQAATDALWSPEAYQTFPDELPLPYGAFYNGWSTYTLGKKLALEKISARQPDEVARFRERCAAISKALSQQASPYLASYIDGAWPADGIVCVAALSLHDRLFQPAYSDVRARWLRRVKALLDPQGLVPHAVHPTTGLSLEHARGSSLGLSLIFLKEIDGNFARDQYALYKKHFIVWLLGLPAVREYPVGEFGSGDIDSGPVIAGAGGAASIVGTRTLGTYGDTLLSRSLRAALEGLALPSENERIRKYFWGSWPMADAFLAWADAHETHAAPSREKAANWRARFHFYSGCAAACLLALIFWLMKKRVAAKPPGETTGRYKSPAE